MRLPPLVPGGRDALQQYDANGADELACTAPVAELDAGTTCRLLAIVRSTGIRGSVMML